MAYPTFDTDGSGTDKFLQLIDFSEDSWAMAAIETAVVGASKYGWMGIATHVEGDAIAAAGGFNPSGAPIVLVGGDKGGNVAALDIGPGAEAAALLVTIATDSSGTLTIDNLGLTELAAAINSSKLDVDLASSTVDVMLGSDFSAVLGTGSLVTTTQADNLANTLDGLNTTTFNYVYDGSTWDRMLGNSTDGVLVNLGGNNDVAATLQAGTAEFGKLAAGSATIGEVTIGAATFAAGDLAKKEDEIHASGDVGIMALAVRQDALSVLAADADYIPLSVQATGYLRCSIINDTGDISVTGTVTAGNTAGDKAHDAPDAGNPVKIGGRAQTTGQPEEVSTDNDRVDALFDRNGYLHVRGELEPLSKVIKLDTSGTGTGTNEIIAAVASKRIAVWGLAIISDGTSDVRFEDGNGGTALTGQMPLQAREGFVLPPGPAPWWIGSANTNLNLELSADIGQHGVVSYSLMDD